ncbi:MAG: hypothetical protein ACI4F4_00040 [Lachnospiraceae bacterium]
MKNGHIFSKETDSTKIAMEIFTFLKKWGLWKEVQIFTGGKCYTDEKGELQIRDEACLEKYTTGITGIPDCNGDLTYADYSNPERLLDMTFEGPLYLLLNYGDYEVCIDDTSEEVRHFIIEENSDFQEEVDDLMEAYLEGKIGWDPIEYDSYEEWLQLNRYYDMDAFIADSEGRDCNKIEFSSREEYEDFILRRATVREAEIRAYFEDVIYDSTDYSHKIFFHDGKVPNQIIKEFNDLLAKYGLRYELGFSWSLTTYRI